MLHAAAYKHVPLMELAPDEAVKTNVLGTLQVIEACERHGVERFVLISTDKAVAPANIMGLTKSLAERVMLAATRARKLQRGGGALRQRAREPRLRGPDLRGAAAPRRSAHRHRPGRSPATS